MSPERHVDLLLVGGGIVGLASACTLGREYPDLKILLVEKETRYAAHQTGHNSGVIHSGIYYKPGSHKAKNCVEGRRRLIEFCREHGVPHDICGKIIVATSPSEIPAMEKIFENGKNNGVEGMERLDEKGIAEIEPHCRGVAGLWVPGTGIVSFAAVAEKMAEVFRSTPGHETWLNCEVQTLRQVGPAMDVGTNRGAVRAKHVIACGGLQCDRLSEAGGLPTPHRVVPFRGDYYELSERGHKKVRNLIYPVPDPNFPFLGVHFTRMIDGSVECGPNAVFSFKREGYGRTDFDARDTWTSLSYPGTWKLFAKHWRYGLGEMRRAFSKAQFLLSLQKLIPDLAMEDIEPARAGVRAVLLGPDGKFVDDFQFVRGENMLHVMNTPSPAATASLAIAAEVCRQAGEHFGLNS